MSEPVYDITDDVKRDVLAATDLVQLVGTTTSLKKAGRSWKGLCPFHGEKTPSFHVHPDKGFYYCFGCGAKGDAITFVRETERLEFPEAVAYLARLAGITLPMRRSGTRVDRGKETRTSEALALAAAFFRANLDRHAAARALLEKRGLPLDDARRVRLRRRSRLVGRAEDALVAHVQEDTLVDAGLLQKNPETGRVYDRFRNRLTIEIRDGARRDPRLRRARLRRRPAEVPELAGDGTLLEGQAPLRPRPREGGDPQGGRRPARRGLFRPHRVRTRRRPERGRLDGDGAHARADGAPQATCADRARCL